MTSFKSPCDYNKDGLCWVKLASGCGVFLARRTPLSGTYLRNDTGCLIPTHLIEGVRPVEDSEKEEKWVLETNEKFTCTEDGVLTYAGEKTANFTLNAIIGLCTSTIAYTDITENKIMRHEKEIKLLDTHVTYGLLLEALYRERGSGGSLHIFTDNGCDSDEDLAFCRKCLKENTLKDPEWLIKVQEALLLLVEEYPEGSKEREYITTGVLVK